MNQEVHNWYVPVSIEGTYWEQLWFYGGYANAEVVKEEAKSWATTLKETTKSDVTFVVGEPVRVEDPKL